MIYNYIIMCYIKINNNIYYNNILNILKYTLCTTLITIKNYFKYFMK